MWRGEDDCRRPALAVPEWQLALRLCAGNGLSRGWCGGGGRCQGGAKLCGLRVIHVLPIN